MKRPRPNMLGKHQRTRLSSALAAFVMATAFLATSIAPAQAATCYFTDDAMNWSFYGGTAYTEIGWYDYPTSCSYQTLTPKIDRTKTDRSVPWNYAANICDYDSYHKVDDSRDGYATTYRHFSTHWGCSWDAWFVSGADRTVGNRSTVDGYWKDTMTGGAWKFISRTSVRR